MFHWFKKKYKIDIEESIKNLIGYVPQDLLEFYKSDEIIESKENNINILGFKDALQQSKSMNTIGIVNRLGLWVLEDGNNSNHFCYITKGPCKGFIMCFCHDGEPSIYYGDLRSFLDSVIKLVKCGKDIDDLKHDKKITLNLNTELQELVKENNDDATFLICLYLRLCKPLNNSTINNLVNSKDMFVREAIANYVENNPDVNYYEFAVQLSNDSHSQVKECGKLALKNINKIKYAKYKL
jgi:hypothetical protein